MAEAEVGITKLALETPAGMEHGKRPDGDDDHRSFQDHEDNFVVGQRSIESLVEFCNTVDATDEDQDSCYSQSGLEPNEAAALAQPVEEHLAVLLAPPLRCNDTPSKVGGHDHEETETGDLKCKTSNHDVDAGLLQWVTWVSNRGHGTAGRLQDERHDVARDENLSVGARPEERILRAMHNHNSSQAQVDGSCEEGWSDGETDNVAVVRLRSAKRIPFTRSTLTFSTYTRNGFCAKMLLCIMTRPM